MTYPHANALREGPNVSHRRASAPSLILRGAIVAAIGIWALYAWRTI
jgi:hypothetical protein